MNEYKVAIIGGGLTGLATAYFLSKEGVRCIVVEREDRCGGMIESYRQRGFTIESGPNTGVVGNREVVELFSELEGECQKMEARQEAKRRLVLKNGVLYDLPSGLISGIKTPLFSFSDKLRVLGEPFRARGTERNESVADMVRRRLGNSILNYAVDPFIGGIYAGDPNRLVTKFALPKLYNLEQNYGSFIVGTLKRAKAAKAEREAGVSKSIFSTKGGLNNLTEALERKILNSGNAIVKSARAVVMPRNEGGYLITIGEDSFSAERVISTVPAFDLQRVLPFIDNVRMQKITSLNYAGVVQVAVGYESLPKEIRHGAVNSFGALFPYSEGSEVLGILFPSSCFEGRAPKDGALLSLFIGGVRHSEVLTMGDDEIEKIALQEISAKLKISQKPTILKIFRHPRAIAQYEASSGGRFEAIESIENEFNGLYLGGGICGGIGMADRIKQAKRLSNEAAK